jgi:hypothetical protein
MKIVKRRLAKEAVGFLERCQQNALSGEMDIDTYISLTGTKLKFLRTLAVCEKDSPFADGKLRKQLFTLHVNNDSLIGLPSKLDGKGPFWKV